MFYVRETSEIGVERGGKKEGYYEEQVVVADWVNTEKVSLAFYTAFSGFLPLQMQFALIPHEAR